MKRFTLILAIGLSCFAGLFAAEQPNAQDQQLAATIKEIQAQQALMAETQVKIDEKLAVVAEAVRIARIYSSRGGH